MKLQHSIALALLSAPTITYAALGPIVITPTKVPTELKNSLSPTLVITQDDINGSSEADVAGIIKFYAGIDIARTGGEGAVTSIFVRGTESDHVLVLINGVPVNSATVGSAAIQTISPDQVEQIEIVKGPKSSLYGSNAIGGVINIITRKQTNTQIGFTAGSNNTNRVGFSKGYLGDDISFNLSYSNTSTNGYLDKTASNKEHSSNNESIGLNLQKMLDTSVLEFSHLQTKGQYEYESFGSELEQTHNNSINIISAKTKINDTWSSTLSLSSIQDHIDQTLSNDYAYTNRNALEWQNDIALENQLWSIGVNLQDTHADSLSFGTQFDEKIKENSVFIQNNINVQQHHLIIAARATDNEQWGKHNTYNLDYAYQLNNKQKITFSYGTGFKAPDFSSLYGFGGNLDLKAETSLSKELGYHFQVTENHTFSINYFDTKIDNLIFAKATFKNINIEEARIKGFDLSYQGQLAHWKFNAGLIFQDPQDVTNDVILSRRAKKSFSMNAQYSKDQFSASAHVIAVGERDDSYYSATRLSPYELLNIQAKYRLNTHISVSASVENLTDEEYETAAGYPAKGRSYFLSFKVTD